MRCSAPTQSVICLLSGDEQIRQLECHSPWHKQPGQKEGVAFVHGEHWAQAIPCITLRRTYRLGPNLWRVAESMLRAARIPSSVEAFGPAEGEFRVRCRGCSATAIRWLLANVADGQHDLVVCGTAAELRDILNQTRTYGDHAFRIPEGEMVEAGDKLERFVAHLSRGSTSHRCVFTTSHRAQGGDERYVAFVYIPHRTDAWPTPQRVQGCEFFTHLFVSLTRASLLCALYTTTGELYEHLCSLVPELRNISPDEPTRATVGSARVQMTLQPSPRPPSVPPPVPAAILGSGQRVSRRQRFCGMAPPGLRALGGTAVFEYRSGWQQGPEPEPRGTVSTWSPAYSPPSSPSYSPSSRGSSRPPSPIVHRSSDRDNPAASLLSPSAPSLASPSVASPSASPLAAPSVAPSTCQLADSRDPPPEAGIAAISAAAATSLTAPDAASAPLRSRSSSSPSAPPLAAPSGLDSSSPCDSQPSKRRRLT